MNKITDLDETLRSKAQTPRIEEIGSYRKVTNGLPFGNKPEVHLNNRIPHL